MQQERLHSQQFVIWIDPTSLWRSQLTRQPIRETCHVNTTKYTLFLAKIIFSINGSKYTKVLGIMMCKVHRSRVCAMCMQQLFAAANSPNLLWSHHNWVPIVTEINCYCCKTTRGREVKLSVSRFRAILNFITNFTKRGHFNLKSSIYALTSVPMWVFPTAAVENPVFLSLWLSSILNTRNSSSWK